MKTLPAFAAVAIALALLVTPVMSLAAGSITVTPSGGASYKGNQSYTISGTVSPAPSGPDQVGLTVKNPTGQTVDVASVPVTSGAFSYATATGGTNAWTSGTYTISATDSFGATGSAAFTYTATSAASYNVTAALIKIQKQLNASALAEATEQKDMKGNFTAITSALSAISTSLTSISSGISTLTSNLNTVSQAVTGLQSSLTSIGTQVGQINTAVSGLGAQVTSAASAATNASNAVGNVSNYVLVVAVLAAITLVPRPFSLTRETSLPVTLPIEAQFYPRPYLKRAAKFPLRSISVDPPRLP